MLNSLGVRGASSDSTLKDTQADACSVGKNACICMHRFTRTYKSIANYICVPTILPEKSSMNVIGIALSGVGFSNVELEHQVEAEPRRISLFTENE